MNQQEIDKKIEQFLEEISDNYTFSDDDIAYLKQYSGCDVGLSDNVISKLREIVMKRMPSVFDETTVNFPSLKPKHLLAVGYGADKVLAGNYATVTAFQADYYCYMASQGINQEKIKEGSYRLKFRNLADFFTNYKGNNIKYSAVVVMPIKSAYHRMDTDSNYAFADSYVYYVLRGYLFTKTGGTLFAAIPQSSKNAFLASIKPFELGNVEIDITMVENYLLVRIEKP